MGKGESLDVQLTDEARAYYNGKRLQVSKYAYLVSASLGLGTHWLLDMHTTPPVPGITKGQAEEAMLRYRIGNAMAIFHMPTDRTLDGATQGNDCK